MIPVPYSLPPAVSVQWSPSCSSAIVWCAACRTGQVLYTTVIKRNPNAVENAIREHEKCRVKGVP